LSFQPFLEKNVGLMIDEVERMTLQVDRWRKNISYKRGTKERQQYRGRGRHDGRFHTVTTTTRTTPLACTWTVSTLFLFLLLLLLLLHLVWNPPSSLPLSFNQMRMAALSPALLILCSPPLRLPITAHKSTDLLPVVSPNSSWRVAFIKTRTSSNDRSSSSGSSSSGSWGGFVVMMTTLEFRHSIPFEASGLLGSEQWKKKEIFPPPNDMQIRSGFNHCSSMVALAVDGSWKGFEPPREIGGEYERVGLEGSVFGI